MFIELLLALTLGCTFGIITGLTPGVHINLVSVILITISPKLLTAGINPISIGVFIIAMSVVHSFLDAIPGIYLGAPDEAQALSVLPGHKMLLKGDGHEALMLTIIGSFFSLVLCIVLVPIFLLVILKSYNLVDGYIGIALIAIMTYMLLKDNKRVHNIAIFFMAGSLGLLVVNMPNSREPLFPLLSGLFGFSILIMSLIEKSTIPKQNPSKEFNFDKKDGTKAVIGATIVGFIASFLPGFSSSQGAIIATQFLKKIGDKGFLILVGGINTVNFTLSIVTLYAIDKARNGAVIALREIVGKTTMQPMLIYFCTALVAGGVAVLLAITISKVFCKVIAKVDYNKLVIGIMVFVTTLVFLLCGILGIFVLAVSTFVGLYASSIGVGKNHLMGCLIIPVILFFVL